MGNKNVRRIEIQYPDGKFHDIEARSFFGVKLDGEERLILEYCDFTDNNSNSFAVIARENGHFVKKPLSDPGAYTNLYRRIVWRRKKPYDLELLPEKIHLCAEALAHLVIDEDLSPLKKPYQEVGGKPEFDQEIHPVIDKEPVVIGSERDRGSRRSVATHRQLIVYVDVAPDHDPFPYYLGSTEARYFGLSNSTGYYHLTPVILDALERQFDILYLRMHLGLGKPMNPNYPGWNEPRYETRAQLIVYVDVSPNHEPFPYYLGSTEARYLGLSDGLGYYHLTPEQLEELKERFDIEYRNVHLGFGKVIVPGGPGGPGGPVAPHRNGGPGSPGGPVAPGGNGGPSNPSGPAAPGESGGPGSSDKKRLVVIEDISEVRDKFPYYIDTHISAQVGEGKREAYHHLTLLELEELEIKYDVVIEQRELNLLPQNPYKFNPMNSRTIREFTLSSSEKEIIEELYRKLPDFTNYYEFFGIEDMRGMSYEEIFNSERMRAIARIIKQGARDGDVISLSLFEFLEGFKEEFNKNMILK